MTVTLKIRSGPDANVAGAPAADGEPLWTTDGHVLWISQGGVKYRVGPTVSTLPDPVTPAHGGTGQTTLTAHAVLLGEGAGNVAFAAAGTAGRILIDQGPGADPAFEPVSGDATLSSAGILTLADTGVAAGSSGGAAAIPTLTVDAKGRLTALSSTPITDLGSVSQANVLTHYSGTTADAYVTLFDTGVVAGGLIGGLRVTNSAAAHALEYRLTATDAAGTTAVHTGTVNLSGTDVIDFSGSTVLDSMLGANAYAPFTEIKLEIHSAAAGLSTTYDVYLDTTPAGAAVTTPVPALKVLKWSGLDG